MHRILYIDEPSPRGVDRFRNLHRLLIGDGVLTCAFESEELTTIAHSQCWDLLVADLRGLGDRQQCLIDELIETSPDTILVLIIETRNQPAAEAMLRHGAVDCVSWLDGDDSLCKSVRRNLSRLSVARSAITSTTHRIVEFDVRLEIGVAPDAADALATYTLQHIAQTDVCGLRNQMRAIRAFEEAVDLLLFKESLKFLDTNPDSNGNTTAAKLHSDAGRLPFSVTDIPLVRVRIHLSRHGYRFTLRGSGDFGDDDGLWYALLMDEMEFDEANQELTMLQLPDDVCRDVSQSIARHRTADPAGHDLLDEVLSVMEPEIKHPSRG